MENPLADSLTTIHQTLNSHLSRLISYIPSPTSRCTCPPSTLIPPFLAALTPLISLPAIQSRTLTTGTASFLDTLILCPGIHTQQSSDVLPGGAELPATAAMTTGYVFRTENQGMVMWLRRVGVVGALVSVSVSEEQPDGVRSWSLAYMVIPVLTLAAVMCIVLLHDHWALVCLVLLIAARLANVVVLRRRAVPGWHGIKEPGVRGDLLVLMNQDRWLRLQGLVDDLKAVTSGSWLEEMTAWERVLVAVATGLVYFAAACAMCTTFGGSVLIVGLLTGSAGLLTWNNSQTTDLRMHGRLVRVVGEPKRYERRLDMAKELIKEHGRDDWAIGLGMIVPDHDRVEKATM